MQTQEALQPEENFSELEARKEKSGRIYWLTILLLLFMSSLPVMIDVSARSLLFYPFLLIFELLLASLFKVPLKNAIIAALDKSKKTWLRTLLWLSFLIPCILLLVYFSFQIHKANQNAYGNNPILWQQKFYENEIILNDLNQTILDPDRPETWFVSEIHSPIEGKKIMVSITDQKTSEIVEEGLLSNSKLLSDQEKEKIDQLLTQLRVPYSKITFTHNTYNMEKGTTYNAYFSVITPEVIQDAEQYDRQGYREGNWVLYTEEQLRFPAPSPDMGRYLLEDQQSK